MKCLVGIDDTDSSNGLCTTYLAFKLASRASEGNFRVSAYPRLVRLNPNIPFKTRGNAAISLPFETEDPSRAFRFICSVVEELSDVKNGANSGVVLLEDDTTRTFFRDVYEAALTRVLNKEGVIRLLRENRVRYHSLGNGMGLVGASASLAFGEAYDHSYELIAYRRRSSWGTPRKLDAESVRQMDRRSFPETFNNYDYEKDRPLIAPHGPDPVFLGIRGSTPSTVLRAFKGLRYEEELEGYMIFLSNQCTDAHLQSRLRLPLKAYYSGWVEGEVTSVSAGPGGHQYVKLLTSGGRIDCAVYRPTGDLQRVAPQLIPGDRVRISGGVRRPSARHPRLLNAESIEALSLASKRIQINPVCPNCHSRMKSEGSAKGFQCRRCGRKQNERAVQTSVVPRRLQVGRYVASPRAHRHLTKPLVRYGRETAGERYPRIEGWISTSPTPSVSAL